jgi:hypothetical protein
MITALARLERSAAGNRTAESLPRSVAAPTHHPAKQYQKVSLWLQMPPAMPTMISKPKSFALSWIYLQHAANPAQ